MLEATLCCDSLIPQLAYWSHWLGGSRRSPKAQCFVEHSSCESMMVGDCSPQHVCAMLQKVYLDDLVSSIVFKHVTGVVQEASCELIYVRVGFTRTFGDGNNQTLPSIK